MQYAYGEKGPIYNMGKKKDGRKKSEQRDGRSSDQAIGFALLAMFSDHWTNRRNLPLPSFRVQPLHVVFCLPGAVACMDTFRKVAMTSKGCQ